MRTSNAVGETSFKRKEKTKHNDRAPDPTPMQIARRSAMIRAQWDEVTRLKRAGMLPEDLEASVQTVDTSHSFSRS